jgi:hypothetical protein
MVCETFLKRNVSAILFLSNTELYGRNIAAAQYFLQLTNYLRIPVVAWNADNSGLEKVQSMLLDCMASRLFRIIFDRINSSDTHPIPFEPSSSSSSIQRDAIKLRLRSRQGL